jgi:transposase-like protein
VSESESDGKERCGYEDTTTDHPCRNPAGSCPWHGKESPETGRKKLDPSEYEEEIAGYLADGETVAVACALAGISPATYYEWHARARESDAPEGFIEFSETTARARLRGAKASMDHLKRMVVDEGDTKTAYKLFLNRYGNVLFGEDGDADPEATRVEITIPEELAAGPDVPEAYGGGGE